ncbi:MAG: hypothetical protein KZQ78_01755 [Candidatus Thiodiazotropha sp. (ex Ustalcina ferruginea)]|nr:hypothetical protein [Candidatus Thiodiazotropha sp. (ex Ustalcina ferruginea)]
MKRNGRKYATVIFCISLFNSVNLHAEISTQALLDLTTCYGADFPAVEFQEGVDKDPRIRGMERTLYDIRKMKSVKRADVDGFYTPNDKIEVLGNPLQFIGLHDFGPLSGVKIVLGGSFDGIKGALEEDKGIEYARCDGRSNLHLKVCHQDVTGRYGHVIMTHPQNPKQQVILICVNKQATSS